jgi:hypothetical protein
MDAIRSVLHQAIDALLLREDAYLAMNDSPHPVRRGVAIIVTIGVIVAVAGLIGALLLQWTMPDFTAIKDTVWDEMTTMSWMDEIPAEDREEVIDSMQQGYDLGWQIAFAFIPGGAGAFASVLFTPLGMLVSWVVYGVLAFAAARLLGGRAGLGVTYGATALAAAPQLLTVARIVPEVQIAGIGIWALVCNYLALKLTHRLSPGRAFSATIAPYVILAIVAVALGVSIAVLVAALAPGFVEASGGGA